MNNLSDAKDKRRRNIRYTCGIGTEQPGKSEQRTHKAHVLDGTEMPTEEEMEAIAECLDFTEAPTALTKQVRLRVPEITLTLKKSSEEPKSEQTDLNANFNAPHAGFPTVVEVSIQHQAHMIYLSRLFVC